MSIEKYLTKLSNYGRRQYPKQKEVLQMFHEERAKTPEKMTINEDGDISHPDVTKRYVDKFLRDNHYKA